MRNKNQFEFILTLSLSFSSITVQKYIADKSYIVKSLIRNNNMKELMVLSAFLHIHLRVQQKNNQIDWSAHILKLQLLTLDCRRTTALHYLTVFITFLSENRNSSHKK